MNDITYCEVKGCINVPLRGHRLCQTHESTLEVIRWAIENDDVVKDALTTTEVELIEPEDPVALTVSLIEPAATIKRKRK